MSDKLQFVVVSQKRPLAEAHDKLKFVGHHASSKNLFDQLAVHVGQSEITPLKFVGQPFVVNA